MGLLNFEDAEENNSKKKGKNKQPNSKQDSAKKEEGHIQATDQILTKNQDQQKGQFEENYLKTFNNKYQFQSSSQKSEVEESNIFFSSQKQSSNCSSPMMRDSQRTKQVTLSIFETKKHKKDITKEKFTEELFQFFQQQNFFLRFSKICKRRHQLLQKGIDKLYNQIDIFYLVQKLLEVEKLKHLLLNENQIKLFEFIPKPVLTLDEKQSNNLSDKVGLLYHQKGILHQANDAQQAFQQIISSKTKPSKIDARILELLELQFKQFLQNLAEDQKQSPNLVQSRFEKSQSKMNLEQQNDYGLEDLQVAIEESTTYKQKSSYFNFSPSKTLGGIYSSQKKEEQVNSQI